jgi:hypothetical protein
MKMHATMNHDEHQHLPQHTPASMAGEWTVAADQVLVF